MTLSRTTELAGTPVATVRARAAGYAVDMIIFSAIVMLITVVAGGGVLIATSGATQDPTDAELYGFLATIGIGAPVIWSALNLALLLTRRQTGGQYVAGLRVSGDDGGRPATKALVAWWFLLNPVLFSWPMALTIGFPVAGVVALALSRATIAVFGAIVILCAIAPLVALVSALFDRQNRALHDRIAGTLVVPAE